MQINIFNFFRFIKHQIKRLKHLKASPHQIALGFSCGVWCNFTPVLGIHILMSIGLAFVLRANVIASIVGVLLTGLPFIFPFFWLISWYCGSYFLSFYNQESIVVKEISFFENVTESFTEILLGSVILLPVCLVLVYVPLFLFVKFWQNKKLKKSFIKKGKL